MSGKLTKTFGTFLRNNSKVNLKASHYNASIDKSKIRKDLPTNFNPVEKWGEYLSPIYDQGSCGNCWACSTIGCLMDRISILSLGQSMPLLSSEEVTICNGVISSGNISPDSRAEINMRAHSSVACTGNTIYNAIEYLYMYGSIERECFAVNLLKEKGYDTQTKFENPEDLPFCKDVLGINWDTCLDNKTPARFFRTIATYNISSDIDEIKNEIYHWGPVVSGMNVYSNFLKYDGKLIYQGPDKNDTQEGGHAVKIVGWGSEGGVNYWWIANSWGTQWGLLGFFKMKMNILECELEKNIVAFIPDIPTFDLKYLDYKIIDTSFNKNEREWFGVDNSTGYKYSSLEKFKKENLSVYPIFDVSLLPDYSSFVAGEIDKYSSFPKPLLYFSLEDESKEINLGIVLFLLIVPLFLALIFNKIINK